MVRQSLLKKIAIPFTAITTSSLLFTFNSAKAEIKSPFQLGYEMYKQNEVKLNLPFADKWEQTVNVWLSIGNTINSIQQWFINLPENIIRFSIDLLAFIFDLITKIVLVTPTFIFNNSYSNNLSTTLAVLSIIIVTALTMIESIKKIINNKYFKVSYTNYSDILKRWAVACIGVGFAPFAFEQTFKILNWLSNAISNLALSGMQLSETVKTLTLSTGDAIVLLLFDIVVLALMIPIALQNGRRWWNLFCLSSITPLSLTAWIFDDYRHLHRKWWNNVKTLATTQLVYAMYVGLMGVLIFSTQLMDANDPFSIYAKTLLVIGGLLSMTDIPKFVLSKVDQNGDMLTGGENIIKKSKDLYDTVTLRKVKARLISGALGKTPESIKKNPTLISKAERRKQTGKRFNK